ncbi:MULTISPECIES: ABC transporter ATP-binding protein [unclassified Motilimonas]|uniref:ABC transporter ATP-binding protein n=1 Tax=Motilimonas TaxID=1914248 RepID=UPI001E5CA255|nr:MULTISPECIES: ABC transporter ATP-binding protein [unclassified Motilimonas]MCE0555408.1 ABC transporter ATP-binding protein [Motilimonas sp. E26]MDO6527635.1 ABC transporter ATP-binding protein [Motilimonas sp. 1_MG-2023]
MTTSQSLSQATEQPTLVIKNLCVDYLLDESEFRAVDNVSFNINKGEIFGLAGESGCGKSTIAFAISQLLRPPAYISGGEILLNGDNTLTMDKKTIAKTRWSKVSMVFQSAMNSLNPVLTIEEQFRDMFYRHKGYDETESAKRAGQLLELVGINPNRLKDYPHQFSGGMRQRIVIAIGLALNPDLLIMDEPTTALDVVVQREILLQIHALRKEFGFSVLFITHDLSLMTQLCDRIGVMLKGELVEVGKAKDILHRPQHPYTQKLWQSIPAAFEQNIAEQRATNTREVFA